MFIAASAHAQLYRWVDPDSGSVKFSSLPPSDARVQAEVITPRSAPLPNVAPARPPQQVAPLEERWRQMLAKLMGVSEKDVVSSPDAVRQQVEMLQAMRAELDRTDPEGAPRRQQDQIAALEQLGRTMARAWRKADK